MASASAHYNFSNLLDQGTFNFGGKMSKSKDDNTASQEFTSYYLQQSTKEFAEDLDKIRSADDFKADALPMLVKSLQQGTSMFSPSDQRRIVDAKKAKDSDEVMSEGDAKSS
ncbi:ribosome-assembly protein 3-domain-containing protein [Xylariomycetidae sp. FL2044]|nr:ribosome-assembly protein 3-domain-containing protein [Xylariomycetidae sp. FL2044]